MDAEDFMPSPLAVRMHCSHSSVVSLYGAMIFLTLSTKISPARAGDGLVADSFELFQRVLERELADVRDVDELGGGKRVQIHRRKLLFDLREDVEVPVNLQLGVQPALEEDLGAALLDGVCLLCRGSLLR